MITRDEAIAFLNEKLDNPNLIKHCLATEAIMRALAPRFGGDQEVWGLTGLLHDIDLGEVGDDMSRHAEVGAGWLAEKGFDEVSLRAVRAHNDELGIERQSDFEHLLAAAETVTGLIVATALVYPDKKLASVKPKSISKRMKEKNFAAGARREIIYECEKAGIELTEFILISLEAMRGISDDLGL